MDDVFEIHRNGDRWTLVAGADVRDVGSPRQGEIEAHILRWAPPKETTPIIRSDEDFEAASQRAHDLVGRIDDSDKERELAKQVEAIKALEDDADLTRRLHEIIVKVGLVSPEKLQSNARLDEIGLSEDDLILIGNAVEREFDCDVLGASSLEACTTLGQLIDELRRQLGASPIGPMQETTCSKIPAEK